METRDAKYWADKIVEYAVKNRLSFSKIGDLLGISRTTLYGILKCRTKTVNIKTLGALIALFNNKEE